MEDYEEILKRNLLDDTCLRGVGLGHKRIASVGLSGKARTESTFTSDSRPRVSHHAFRSTGGDYQQGPLELTAKATARLLRLVEILKASV